MSPIFDSFIFRLYPIALTSRIKSDVDRMYAGLLQRVANLVKLLKLDLFLPVVPRGDNYVTQYLWFFSDGVFVLPCSPADTRHVV